MAWSSQDTLQEKKSIKSNSTDCFQVSHMCSYLWKHAVKLILFKLVKTFSVQDSIESERFHLSFILWIHPVRNAEITKAWSEKILHFWLHKCLYSKVAVKHYSGNVWLFLSTVLLWLTSYLHIWDFHIQDSHFKQHPSFFWILSCRLLYSSSIVVHFSSE